MSVLAPPLSLELNKNIWIDPNELMFSPNVDFMDRDGETPDELMEFKYDDCDDLFIRSLITSGQKMPVLIRKDRGMYWVCNGHHRIAVALRHDLKIMVVVVPDDQYIDQWDRSESDDHLNCWGSHGE